MSWLKQNWIKVGVGMIILLGALVLIKKDFNSSPDNSVLISNTAFSSPIPSPSPSQSSTPRSVSDWETAIPFAEEISDYESLLGIRPVPPSVGFKTGLASYPTLTWTTKTIKESSSATDTSINMEYPEFVGGAPVLKLNQYIANAIQERVSADRESQKGGDPQDFQSNLLDVASRYRVIGVQNGIVSMEIVIADYTGGGAGNHTRPIVINWDLKSNSLLNASEFFCSGDYKDILVPIIRRHLIAGFEKMFNYHPLPDDMIQWVNEGTTNSGVNQEYFLFRNDGLIVVIPPYQVMSGNSGISRTFIPAKEIPSMICLP